MLLDKGQILYLYFSYYNFIFELNIKSSINVKMSTTSTRQNIKQRAIPNPAEIGIISEWDIPAFFKFICVNRTIPNDTITSKMCISII